MATNVELGKDAKAPIIQDLTLVSPDRSRKDVGKLKAALELADSIHHPSRTRLYDLYHDVVTIDGHLSGIIQKRIMGVTNKAITFLDKSGKKVDDMDALINSNKFNRLIELLIEQRIWGVSGVEFIVGKSFDYAEIPRKHIRPEAREIVRSQYDYKGTPYTDLPFVWVVGGGYDLGKLLQCAMYALYKRSGFGDFAQFVEIFGQPVRVIYYDAHDTATKQELSRLLNESGSSLAMMIPKQAQFEMLDGKTSNGDGKLQMALIQACNSEMSIAILGNTETTASSDSSGYAQSETHAGQQADITKGDVKYVQNMLNEPKFIAILRSYGYPVDGGHFEFEQETNLDELKARFELESKVAEKVPVSDDHWYETYGIPKPANYDELKRKAEEQREASKQEYPMKSRSSNNKQKTDDDDDEDAVVTVRKKGLLAELADFFLDMRNR